MLGALAGYWSSGHRAEMSSARDRMMSETFTNWLTGLQELDPRWTYAHTYSRDVTFFIIMIIVKSISDDEEGREEPRTSSVVVTFDNSSGQKVREMSGGEDEGGAQGEGVL